MKELGILPQMNTIYNNVAGAVGIRFEVDLLNLPPEVKHMDNVMLATEKRDLMAEPQQPWVALPDPLPLVIEPWSPERAKEEFLALWYEITGEKVG